MLAKLRILTLAMACSAVLMGARPSYAQGSGDAELSFQGYYIQNTGQQASSTSGAGVLFREFLPGIGLFKGSLQGYDFDRGFRGGENFLEVQGVPVLGYHWDAVGGDFHMSTNLVHNPFSNLITPELRARGLNLAFSRTDRKISFFIGDETLQEGPRVPFFVRAPQSVFGASWEQSVSERFRFSVRYLHLASSDSAIAADPLLLSENQLFRTVDNFSVQSSYTINKHLQLFGEATAAHSVPAQSVPEKDVPLSFLIGPSWDTQKLSLRANYTYESASYLPLLGYYAGDRKGPYAEGHYRVRPNIEIFASAGDYANNLENNPQTPTFKSLSYTYGASAVLPWKFSASAQASDFRLDVLPFGSSPAQNSRNRQISLTLNRPVGRHNLRLTVMDLNSVSNLSYQHQPSYEFADNFSWRRFVLGAGLRLQQEGGSQARSTLFFHGNAQVHVGPFTAYGYLEKGNDFVASTVFAKNAYSSDTFGVSASIRRNWSLQLEAFRDNLTTNLNPANVFVLESQGVAVPTTLSGFNQWSVYFRASRQLRWGAPVPANAAGDLNAATLLPLVGSVEGLVTEKLQSGTRAVEGVPVSLDANQVVMTDASGSYHFPDVPEGFHVVALAERELPAEFEAGAVSTVKVQIEPRHLTRADLQVVPLTTLTGKVITPQGISAESVVIRLAPGTRYTTPDADGRFTFYNLREGSYDVVLDEESLPADAQLVTPGTLNVTAELDVPSPEIDFTIEVKKTEEPVRQLFQQRLILNGREQANPPSDSAPSGVPPPGGQQPKK